MIPTLSKVVLSRPLLPTVPNSLNHKHFSTLLALTGVVKISMCPTIYNLTTMYTMRETQILYHKYFEKFGFDDKEGYVREHSLSISRGEHPIFNANIYKKAPCLMFLWMGALSVSIILSVTWLYSGYMDLFEGTDVMDNFTRRNMPAKIFDVKIDDVDQAPDQ